MVAGPQNRTDSLYQTVNGLVGNVYWGESFVVVACDFPGLNRTSIASAAPSSAIFGVEKHYQTNFILPVGNQFQGRVT